MTATVLDHDLPVRTDWLALDALLRKATPDPHDQPSDPSTPEGGHSCPAPMR